MSEPYDISSLLSELEHQLTSFHYWQSLAPSETQLSSTLPFSLDTLSCTEWLQWVFIAKIRVLLATEHALPSSIQITPYVEETMIGMKGEKEIVGICKQIDDALMQGMK